MYLLGYDIGSSSVKASLVEVDSGRIVARDFYPKVEMDIIAKRPGWAEQHPHLWWNNLKLVTKSIFKQFKVVTDEIEAIGISWQMHGLVLVDKFKQILRPSIIWCDSRSVFYGEKAFNNIGKERCLSHLLNSPGNFTAAKLAWVKENEPRIYEQIYRFMLPGDYIGMCLTEEITTTVEGLSEGIFWDFKENCLSKDILHYFGFDKSMVPEVKPTFCLHGFVSAKAAEELGLKKGIPVSYKAGDQPNNALSLNVFNPGEIASTAGTSGVIYGVLEHLCYDDLSRINIFAHVNHLDTQIRLGVLLCINGAGILNSWIKQNLIPRVVSYSDMNIIASKSRIGSKGITIVPFGNGSERILGNREVGCSIHGINFNVHSTEDIVRAVQEGVVCSFQYGMEIMKDIGMNIRIVRAGNANMFLSPIFCQTLANVSGVTIELYDTDGSVGAAKGAGIGIGVYKSNTEAFANLKKLIVIDPEFKKSAQYQEVYDRWKTFLIK